MNARKLCIGALALVLSLGASATAAETIQIESRVLEPGVETVRLAIRASTRAGPIDGYILSIAFDPDAVEVIRITPNGPWTRSERPDFVSRCIEPGRIVLGVAFFPTPLDPDAGIPSTANGEPQTIAELDVRLRLENDPEFPVQLRLRDNVARCFDGPPLQNNLVIDGFDYLAGDPDRVLQLRDGTISIGGRAPIFRRGDVDGSGALDITDPIANLGFQFLGTFDPICRDAHDFNDDGLIDISDPIGNLTHQFLGSAPPASPGKEACGPDPTADGLDCASYPPQSCVDA